MPAREVHRFLLGLVGEAPQTQIPPALFALARQVVGRHGTDSEDAVADLLAKLWKATLGGTPGGVRDLLSIDDDRVLLQVLRHRLRQAACQGRRWTAMKSLRAHVRAVMAQPLSDCTAMPLTIVNAGGRLSRPLVARATAALLRTVGSGQTATDIANSIFNAYLSADLLGAEQALEPAPDEVLLAKEAALAEVVRLERVVGAEGAMLLARRADGDTLASLAREQGVALSTAHGRVQRLRARLRRGPSFEARAAALGLIAVGRCAG